MVQSIKLKNKENKSHKLKIDCISLFNKSEERFGCQQSLKLLRTGVDNCRHVKYNFTVNQIDI